MTAPNEAFLNNPKAVAALQITQHTIYLMGGSFVLGSLFTLLLLLILDFIRFQRAGGDAAANEDHPSGPTM
jgi:hypothetical protein